MASLPLELPPPLLMLMLMLRACKQQQNIVRKTRQDDAE